MKQSGWIPRLLAGVSVLLLVADGAYCVDFGATGAVQGVGKSLVKKMNNIEKISAPIAPSGSPSTTVAVAQTYTTGGGASSSLGHAVEYCFYWGDGTHSSWGTATSASHAWSEVGTYKVTAVARCRQDTGVATSSASLAVLVTDISAEVLIPAGNFDMGNASYGGDEVPVHTVHLDAYYIDEEEVSFDQYDAFCTATSRATADDSGYGRGSRPVINITWFDAHAYCLWAGKRLPTEAEWENACRAGTTTKFYWGDDPGNTLAGNYAWSYANSPSGTQPGGGKLANAFGLYDMSGNVWEWVNDWYDAGYYAVSPLNNPPGPVSGTFHITRGGSVKYSPDAMSSAYRNVIDPANRSNDSGCRCAQTP